jgi:hypothetical protein
MGSKKPYELYIVGLSIPCISQSDIRPLHWVPHKLSDSQKASRIESSRVVDPTSPPPVVHPVATIGWGHIFDSNPWGVMVLHLDRSSDDLTARWRWGPDREKCMIQSQKLMLRFAWNPHGFQVVDALACHLKRRDIHGRLLYLKYSHLDHCSAWRERWKEVGLACAQCKTPYGKSDKTVLRWQFLANCTISNVHLTRQT